MLDVILCTKHQQTNHIQQMKDQLFFRNKGFTKQLIHSVLQLSTNCLYPFRRRSRVLVGFRYPVQQSRRCNYILCIICHSIRVPNMVFATTMVLCIQICYSKSLKLSLIANEVVNIPGIWHTQLDKTLKTIRQLSGAGGI